MKIIVAGATGFIGKPLVEALLKKGHEITILSRRATIREQIHGKVRHVIWNPDSDGLVVNEVEGCDAVINLAGEPIVGKRWSSKQKEKILTSRVNAAKSVTHSIERLRKKPAVFVNASAIGYYGSRGSEELTEDSRAGHDFLTEVCKAWEAHAIRAQDFGVRVVRMRIGIVLGRSGGALSMMLPAFKLGLGGWLGNGNQWMSWIHLEDLINLIEFSLSNPRASGVWNAVAPQPVTNKVFSMVLAQVLKRPCFLPAPEFALEILLGEMSTILLGSQRVLPKKAREAGFVFRYPEIRLALESLIK